MFQFWSITLDLELALLIFIRSLREGNFSLYKAALVKLAPWFFSLDHPNYARWLPLHIRDMSALDNICPTIAVEFNKGNFVVHKTQHAFSSIPIDQAHEQNNKQVKGDGGAVGLTENSSQLQRWMVSGPEVSRVVGDFDNEVERVRRKEIKQGDIRHHEEHTAVQKTFRKQVLSLCDTFEEMGNPFVEDSNDLLILDSKEVVDPEVVETIQNIVRVGEEQYNLFFTERLNSNGKSLNDTIKRNKFPLFNNRHTKAASNDKQQIASLKEDRSLFSKLYVSCQVRNGDIDEFLRHENQSSPPSLSQGGNLRHGEKSALMPLIEKLSPCHSSEKPCVDALLLDGTAVVNHLKPAGVKTFQDYANDIFLPFVKHHLQSVSRLDVVWDQYLPNSLKASTGSLRGKGIRRHVKPTTRIPANWESFLR